jgi:hypothetical protein
MKGLMMDWLINPKHVAHASDLKYELRSTENCIIFCRVGHIFCYKQRIAVQNYFSFDRSESWVVTERQLTYGMELIECISKLWTSELKFSKYKLPALRRF